MIEVSKIRVVGGERRGANYRLLGRYVTVILATDQGEVGCDHQHKTVDAAVTCGKAFAKDQAKIQAALDLKAKREASRQAAMNRGTE